MSLVRSLTLLPLVLLALNFSTVNGAPPDALDESVTSLTPDAWEHARKIWEWAEPGYQEVKSSALLSKWLEDAGFKVTRGIGGMPTAFTAEYGSGSPVIAILGEYDALPGLSQADVPYREPRSETNWGQGCGHHLFGVASAQAAIALAREMKEKKLPGTIRYYGCPAEEGGSAKAFLTRDGHFNGVDAALHWHPGSANSAAAKTSLARIALRFRFHGVSAHAAGSPEQGRSALDAVEVTNFAANLMREHMPSAARMHYVITNGGNAPNVVPNEAEVYYYIRHPNSNVVRDLHKRLVKCAEAGALATETRLERIEEGGILELLPNKPLNDRIAIHMKNRMNLQLTPEDLEFAQRLQESFVAPKPLTDIQKISTGATEVSGGSTDVGDVSWVVPTGGFSVACWPPGTPGHSWQAVAAGRTDLARQGMELAAKVLAATARDLLTDEELLDQSRQDFQKRLGVRQFAPLIPADLPPPLNYRDSAIKGAKSSE